LLAAVRTSLKRSTPALAAVQIAAAAALLSCCIALADTIPAVLAGDRTMVAVEPLLRSLEIGYTIRGTHLEADDRSYSNPLVIRDGVFMADAGNLARFLHLEYSMKDGVLDFYPNPADDAPPASPSPDDVESVRSELLDRLNEHRTDDGIAALQTDATAQAAAQFQADDMASAGVMRHSDSQGRTPMERYLALGGRTHLYGENVGWYELDAAGESAMWSAVAKLDDDMMAEQPPDDGHREAILNPQYRAAGIGIAVGKNGLYLAEDFLGQ
jgi:uncharacterized protein YkwD